MNKLLSKDHQATRLTGAFNISVSYQPVILVLCGCVCITTVLWTSGWAFTGWAGVPVGPFLCWVVGVGHMPVCRTSVI